MYDLRIVLSKQHLDVIWSFFKNICDIFFWFLKEIDLDAENDSEDDEEGEEEQDLREVKREVMDTSHIDLVTPDPTPVKASKVVDLTSSSTKPGARVKLEPESPKVG